MCEILCRCLCEGLFQSHVCVLRPVMLMQYLLGLPVRMTALTSRFSTDRSQGHHVHRQQTCSNVLSCLIQLSNSLAAEAVDGRLWTHHSDQGVCNGGGRGSCPPPNGSVIVHNETNNIIVSGEAILNAEHSGEPLGGRGSTRTPLGSSQCSTRPPASGEELAAPP